MPYIPQILRDSLPSKETLLGTGKKCLTGGELNYTLSMIIVGFLDKPHVGYGDYNEVMGVLACMQQELYRRVIGPYEDIKKDINGDIF